MKIQAQTDSIEWFSEEDKKTMSSLLRQDAQNGAKLGLMPVFGNSMTPTLAAGKKVILLQDNAPFQEGGLYAIRYEGEVLIKRLQKLRKERLLRLVSDNPAYEAIEIPMDTQEDLAILGRVVGYISARIP